MTTGRWNIDSVRPLPPHFSLIRLGKQLYICIPKVLNVIRNVAIYKAAIHFHIDPFSSSNSIRITEKANSMKLSEKVPCFTVAYDACSTDVMAGVCVCVWVRALLKTFPMKKTSPTDELYTISPLFIPSHVCFCWQSASSLPPHRFGFIA